MKLDQSSELSLYYKIGWFSRIKALQFDVVVSSSSPFKNCIYMAI